MKTFCCLAMLFILVPAAISGTPTITVLTPSNPTPLVIGSHFTIRWSSTGVTSTVTLALWQNGAKVGVIKSGLPATGQYDWTVGHHAGGTAPVGAGYSIHARNSDNSAAGDSAVFPLTAVTVSLSPSHSLHHVELAASPTLKLTCPAGGETYTAGQWLDIKWNSSGIGEFEMEITLFIEADTATGHISGALIADNLTTADGHFLWKVGDYLKGSLRILPGTYPTGQIRLMAKGGTRNFVDEGQFFTIVVPAN